MENTDSKLTIRDLRKTYGSVIALAGANVDLREGEFLTLLGPSGSGKTTMLMIIAGLTMPDSGDVWIDGKLATYSPPFKRDLGMVFQNYALFPHLSVFENIAFPLRMRKAADDVIAKEVARVLDIIRLPDVGDRLPRQLSGGQQQRIALARCMVYRPSIILMDEPLGALDKKLRDQLQLEIKHLCTELGITVLYVTHDQEEALVMSDRICLMNEGEINQLGTPDDLYFHPRTVFAADFLGESNLLDVRVVAVDSDVVHLKGPGDVALRAVPRGEVPVSNGDDVMIMVRPETIRLLDDGEDAANVVTATLQDTILVGQVTKFYAETADGKPISATRLTHVGAPSAEPGSQVRFGWVEESTVLLPKGERPDGP
ncbi:MAG: ABC transporter ATP-binding protein [Alphaproteobacteria bacterium]